MLAWCRNRAEEPRHGDRSGDVADASSLLVGERLADQAAR